MDTRNTNQQWVVLDMEWEGKNDRNYSRWHSIA